MAIIQFLATYCFILVILSLIDETSDYDKIKSNLSLSRSVENSINSVLGGDSVEIIYNQFYDYFILKILSSGQVVKFDNREEFQEGVLKLLEKIIDFIEGDGN